MLSFHQRLIIFGCFLMLISSAVLAADTPTDPEREQKEKELMLIREGLNVNKFASPDYPAAFGIIAGVSIVLIVAVTFIVSGLLSMEPAKDSIIYRMTNTRMKKD